MSTRNPLFTIGYAPYKLPSLIEVLQRYKVTAVADVRSTPYSQFQPAFNRENLEKKIGVHMAYVSMGEFLGARVEDKSCFGPTGVINFDAVAARNKFKEGLQRICSGLTKFRIALLCAEADPINCHRMILISRHLALSEGIDIQHILGGGSLESHFGTEKRLLALHNLQLPNLFMNYEQRLEEAYIRQGRVIAFHHPEGEGL